MVVPRNLGGGHKTSRFPMAFGAIVRTGNSEIGDATMVICHIINDCSGAKGDRSPIHSMARYEVWGSE